MKNTRFFHQNWKRPEECSAAGNADWKRKLPHVSGRNSKFRDDHPIPIVGVPDVVVAEAVDVRLELAAVVVDVGDEGGRYCAICHPRHRSLKKRGAVFYLGHRSPPAYCTN